MTKYVIYNDVHLMSTHKLKINPFEEVHENQVKVYLGDVYDLKNCKRSKVEETKRLISEVRKVFPIWSSGNHELMHEYSQYHVHNEVLFTHGDYIIWGDEKATKYRNKKAGASWFKRKLIIPLFQKYRDMIKRYEIKDETMDRAVEWAKEYGCKYIVVGHKHPVYETRKTRDGVTLIVLPRGKNYLEL